MLKENATSYLGTSYREAYEAVNNIANWSALVNGK